MFDDGLTREQRRALDNLTGFTWRDAIRDAALRVLLPLLLFGGAAGIFALWGGGYITGWHALLLFVALIALLVKIDGNPPRRRGFR